MSECCLFFVFSDPTKESQGAIKFMNCVAILRTKSKTRFFIEYHSSCLESKNTSVVQKVSFLSSWLTKRLFVCLFCLWKKIAFIEFVKSSEVENQENTEGSIKVLFAAHVEVICFVLFTSCEAKSWNYIVNVFFLSILQLTPIISDPEYLLDQHILISITSTDSDESYGRRVNLSFLWTCFDHILIWFMLL